MAGVWWLLFIIIAPVSYFIIDGKLLVPGDEAATLSNIKADTALFLAGAAAFIAGYICFIMLVKTLRKLFRSADPGLDNLTKWMTGFVITGTLLVLTGKVAEAAAVSMSNSTDTDGLLNLRTNIEMAGELFWGLWLVPLAILIFKSKLIPGIIGGAALLGVFYHLITFGVFFTTGTDVSAQPLLLIPGTTGELSIVLWLLIKGAKP